MHRMTKPGRSRVALAAVAVLVAVLLPHGAASAADPDVTIAYFLLLTTNQESQSMGQFLPPTMAWGLPLFPQATTSMKVLNQGALVLDLSAKGSVVWRGVAQAQLKPDTDFKKREALIREGVRDLLKRYPPKP